MNAVERYALKAAEYRARAEDDAARGRASALQSVREKHERAAQTWTDLADAEDLRAAQSRTLRPVHQPS